MFIFLKEENHMMEIHCKDCGGKEFARKEEMCTQLKNALPDIKQLILQAAAQRDLVSFAYNYYRSIFCEHAEEMSFENLEQGCSLLFKECDWGFPPKTGVNAIYVLPQEYNRDNRLGNYTVRDLIGCAIGKIQGTRDCSDDFFSNHCKY